MYSWLLLWLLMQLHTVAVTSKRIHCVCCVDQWSLEIKKQNVNSSNNYRRPRPLLPPLSSANQPCSSCVHDQLITRLCLPPQRAHRRTDDAASGSTLALVVVLVVGIIGLFTGCIMWKVRRNSGDCKSNNVATKLDCEISTCKSGLLTWDMAGFFWGCEGCVSF